MPNKDVNSRQYETFQTFKFTLEISAASPMISISVQQKEDDRSALPIS
jgi:hypothetical protein